MKRSVYSLFFAVSLLLILCVFPANAEEISPTQSGPTESIQSPTPGPTTLAVTLFLHGIGKAGDSVNQTPSGTDAPIHTSRHVTVTLYDAHKNLIATQAGTVVYDSASGSFQGSVVFDKDCPSGTYSIEVNTDRYLKQFISDPQTITAGTTTQLAPVNLVAGDANNDEYLDIVDYSIVIGCFSELMPATSCNDTTKALGDFNDDGVVNQFDYNLFLRELTKQAGR